MAIYESMEYLFCYNEEKTETSKLRKLVTRAHRLARNALGSERNTQSNLTESTGLLTEEIPMQTLNSDGQGSRSENSRSCNSGADEDHFGASSISSHVGSSLVNEDLEMETNLDSSLPVQCNVIASGNQENSSSSSVSVVSKIISAIFPKKRKESAKYIPLEDCDNSEEESVIFEKGKERERRKSEVYDQQASVQSDELFEEPG